MCALAILRYNTAHWRQTNLTAMICGEYYDGICRIYAQSHRKTNSAHNLSADDHMGVITDDIAASLIEIEMKRLINQ